MLHQIFLDTITPTTLASCLDVVTAKDCCVLFDWEQDAHCESLERWIKAMKTGSETIPTIYGLKTTDTVSKAEENKTGSSDLLLNLTVIDSKDWVKLTEQHQQITSWF